VVLFTSKAQWPLSESAFPSAILPLLLHSAGRSSGEWIPRLCQNREDPTYAIDGPLPQVSIRANNAGRIYTPRKCVDHYQHERSLPASPALKIFLFQWTPISLPLINLVAFCILISSTRLVYFQNRRVEHSHSIVLEHYWNTPGVQLLCWNVGEILLSGALWGPFQLRCRLLPFHFHVTVAFPRGIGTLSSPSFLSYRTFLFYCT
jgi:hypothetical protein